MWCNLVMMVPREMVCEKQLHSWETDIVAYQSLSLWIGLRWNSGGPNRGSGVRSLLWAFSRPWLRVGSTEIRFNSDLQVRALHAITFVQAAEENLTQAWERFNGYFQQGLDLGFAKELIVQTFYLVLNKKSMVQLDATSGGCFSKLSVEQGMKIM